MGSKYEILSTEVDLNFALKLRTPENKKESFYKTVKVVKLLKHVHTKYRPSANFHIIIFLIIAKVDLWIKKKGNTTLAFG